MVAACWDRWKLEEPSKGKSYTENNGVNYGIDRGVTGLQALISKK